jgi:hypothetical protein
MTQVPKPKTGSATLPGILAWNLEFNEHGNLSRFKYKLLEEESLK